MRFRMGSSLSEAQGHRVHAHLPVCAAIACILHVYVCLQSTPPGVTSSGMAVGQYLSVRMPQLDEQDDIVRFYSPISRPDSLGTVDLLVKALSHDRGTL